MKELNNLHIVQHTHNDKAKIKDYNQNLNLYYYNNIQSLETKKAQFLQRDSEIADYEI